MSSELYHLIEARARQSSSSLKQMLLGLNWSLAELEDGSQGLCFSPSDTHRDLPWPGTLAGRDAAELVGWLHSWQPTQAAVGCAVSNALINRQPWSFSLQNLYTEKIPHHLSVFAHFAPMLTDAQVVVIGRYPGLDSLPGFPPYVCIEKKPGPDLLPEAAIDFELPRADWVFITASSIANKTCHRLLAQSRHARVVLMGPSMPWLEEWQDFGVNYLAGVRIHDAQKLRQVVGEAGGTRIFGCALNYHLFTF